MCLKTSHLRPMKIESAEAFFKQLKKQGVNVEYRIKLNSPDLSQMISEIQISKSSI